MRVVKSIELQFENCECLRLEKVLGYFYIGKIEIEVERIACNCIAEVTYANEIAIEIFNEVEKLGTWITCWDNYDSKLQRIYQYNDIAHIVIVYEDGTECSYCINYEEESSALGAPNVNQKTYLSSLGNLYIVISPDKNIEDFFPKEDIEDKEMIDFRKRMYDIGVNND